MKTHKIALYPGDGIGQEVTPSAVRVLERCAELDGGFRLDFTGFPWGVEYHRETGEVVPDDYLETLRRFDAVLLGAVGYPSILPDHITLAPLVRMRQTFDLYACVRPARLFPGVRGPLGEAGEIDLVVLRENSEGEYLPVGGRFKKGSPDEIAVQSAVHSRRGVERILRFGFEMARTRRRGLTMITKSNALRFGFVLWDEVLSEISPEYPDVAVERLHADAAAMDLVRRPSEFDVIVASNLFGDLLTDLSAVVSGGLGLAPSANIDPTRSCPSLFEPVHGSAPDIAGRGIANPVAAVLSAAMMMEWLDEEAAAARMRRAVESALREGCATRDLGGSLGTEEMTAQICARLDPGA